MAQREAATQPDHEELCRHCGKCCFEKVIVKGRVHITPFPCRHLDIKTRLCRIYPRRFELNQNCLSVERGLRLSAFPADCPYVARLAPQGYAPALEDWTWTGQWQEFDELADDLDVSNEMRELVRARGPHAPPLFASFPGRLKECPK